MIGLLRVGGFRTSVQGLEGDGITCQAKACEMGVHDG